MIARRTRQRGSASMVAIIWALLLMAVAAMAGVMAASGNYAGNLHGLGERAGMAAQSGMQWGAYQSSQGVCLPKATFKGASALPGHAEMTVIVTCSATARQEGPSTITQHNYVSLACSNDVCPMERPARLYGERSESATFWHSEQGGAE